MSRCRRGGLDAYSVLLALLFAPAGADEARTADDLSWGTASPVPDRCALDPAEEDEHAVNYGPDSSVSRGTLFQWSYGTSFGGGPKLDEPLVTDRPDFTEASVTVGRGVSQVEFGYTYIYHTDDGTSFKTQSLGEPLLRHGIFADWLEFRVALFPIWERESSGVDSNTTAGTADLYLGLKFALTPQEGILPEMALVPQMTVPTGSPNLTDDRVLPGVNWLYGWDLTEKLTLAGSTQFNRAVDAAGNTYTEWAQSLSVGYSLTEQLGAYTEWFGFFPAGSAAAAVEHSFNPSLPAVIATPEVEHYFNGGFTYLLSDDMQFDIRAGVGLNSAAVDYFLGTGLSVRFK